MPIPRTYPFTFLSFNFTVKLFWLSCTIFGNRANLNSLEASPQSIQNHKKITKKKKSLFTISFPPPSEGCLPQAYNPKSVKTPAGTTFFVHLKQPTTPQTPKCRKPISTVSTGSSELKIKPANFQSHRNQIFKPISQLKLV